MTLRLKINLIVGGLTLAFLMAVVGLQWRGLRASVSEEVVAANRVASQLLNRTAWLYAAQGTPAMRAFLEGVGRIRSNEVTLYDAQGQELYASPPSPYKAGRDAPEWFALLTMPTPTEQAIDFPDGRLVVRANASRAVLDAWDDLVLLAGSALVVLAAVQAAVFSIVGRTVRPFGQIVRAMARVEHGELDTALPALPGREAAAIGTAFNRMVGELQRQREAEQRATRAEAELSDNRELSRWIDHHIEQERRLIARELHDEFGQSVTAMRSMALSVAQRVGGVDAEAAGAARTIAEESSRLYEAMHGIIPRLTPLVLDRFGLDDALGDLVERTRRSHPTLRVDLRVALGGRPLSSDAALALYRAAQEGLTNALRHGQAQHVALTLEADEADCGVCLTLRDDGVGLPAGGPARAGHYGLRWLLERVQALGGELSLERAEPRGACLRVHLPAGAAA